MIDGSSGGMGPPVRRLMQAASSVSQLGASGTGPEAGAGMDELRAAAFGLQRWSADHPGPDAAMTDRVMVLAARCAFVALTADDAGGGPPGSVAKQLGPVVDELAALVSGPLLDSHGSDIA